MNSSLSSHQAEVETTNLDSLIQSIDDQQCETIYPRRESSISNIPANTIETDKTNKKRGYIRRCFTYIERFSGIFYALLGACFGTCLNFLLKQLNVNMFDVLIIRCLIQGSVAFGFIIYKGYPLFPKFHRLLLLIRSIIEALGVIIFYYCLSLLPLPDLMTLRYTQVIWTAIIAMIIFRERITLTIIIASLLTLIGVICVTQPTFIFHQQKKFLNETIHQQTIVIKSNRHLFGLLLALLCPILISLSMVLNKSLLLRKVQQSLIVFYFLFIALIILLIIRIHYWIVLKSKGEEFNFKNVFLTKEMMFASILIISQLVPVILAQKAVKHEHPSIVTVVQSSDILFALILQNIFTSIKTNLLTLIGSLLVLTSIFIVGGHKFWLDKQNRKRLPITIEENIRKIETNK